MSQETLGAVVVGTGFGILTHARALRKAGIDVVGLVGRNPERTAERAKRARIPHASTSLSEALALPNVDLVTVATPPHTHADIVLEAVNSGKHVMCEKPFARDASEAQRMLDAAEKAGVVHLLGTEFRWATGQAVATRAIAAGAIGEPRLATYMTHLPMLADPKGEVPAWWSSASEGGGWLGAFASHLIDQIRASLGEFEGLSASLGLLSDRADAGFTADDTFTVHFRTRTGVDGVIQSTAGAWGPPVFCSRVAGTQGTLWVEGDTVQVADASGVRTLETPEDLVNPPPDPPDRDQLVTAYDMMHSMGIDIGPFTKLFDVMRNRIHGLPVSEDPKPATFADGLALMHVLDAIRLSSAKRTWVPIG